MSILKKFEIDFCQRDLNFIYKKVSEYPWHEMPSDGGWQFGANIDFMKDLCTYWVEQFDSYLDKYFNSERIHEIGCYKKSDPKSFHSNYPPYIQRDTEGLYNDIDSVTSWLFN